MLRILIADDYAVVRRGVKHIVMEEFRTAEVEEVGDAEDLVKKVLGQQWDLIITDISMTGRSGLDVVQQIRQHNPRLPILILSVYPEDQYGVRVFKAGAAGYLNKDAAPDQLVKAIHQVLLGKKFITPSMAERLAVS